MCAYAICEYNLIILRNPERMTVTVFFLSHISQYFTINIWFTKCKWLKFIETKYLKCVNIWLMIHREPVWICSHFNTDTNHTIAGGMGIFKRVVCCRESRKKVKVFLTKSKFCFFKSYNGRLTPPVIYSHCV